MLLAEFVPKSGLSSRFYINFDIHIFLCVSYNRLITVAEERNLKTFEINEKSVLVIIESQETEKYFPKGEFDLSDSKSRIMLRKMLDDASIYAKRLEISSFGNKKTGFNIFVRYT